MAKKSNNKAKSYVPIIKKPFNTTYDCPMPEELNIKKYNILIDSDPIDNHIYLDLGYDNRDEYNSAFYLTPNQAIELGNQLMEYGIHTLTQHDEYNIGTMQSSILRNLIDAKAVEEIEITPIKLFTMDVDDSLFGRMIVDVSYKSTIYDTSVSFTMLSQPIDTDNISYIDDLKKYLEEHDDIGAMAVSRPTNPSGNVLRDSEIRTLAALSHEYSIPLIIDNAYGLPFPDIVFCDDAAPIWNEDIILSMSLSKVGLPSIRTGIVIAKREIIKAVGNINAIAALATGSFGPVLAEDLLRTGKLTSISQNAIRPFYKAKADKTEGYIRKYFEGTDYYFHKIEGSIFCWIYLPSLMIPALEFYSILMKDGVVTVPGEYFFFPDENGGYPHEHYDKCLRLNYSGDDELVEEGIRIISEKYREYSR